MDDHHARKLFHKFSNLLSFGKVCAVDDSGPVQRLQVRLDDKTLIDGVYAPFTHGYSSSPPIGTDVTMVAVAGDRSSMVVLATGHKAVRHTGLQPGQCVMYDGQSTILLDGSGTVTIKAPKGIVLDTPMVSATHEVAINTSGTAIHATTHTHGGVLPGGGSTAKPNPGS